MQAIPDPDDKSRSKTRRKQAARELQQLGLRLARLPPAELQQLPLEKPVRLAIAELRNLDSHGARKRQIQYVGKLLGRANLAELLQALAKPGHDARQLAAGRRRAEQWRDALLNHGHRALTALLAQYRGLESQPLRAMLRRIDREQQAGKTTTAQNKLLRLLQDADRVAPLPPSPRTLQTRSSDQYQDDRVPPTVS